MSNNNSNNSRPSPWYYAGAAAVAVGVAAYLFGSGKKKESEPAQRNIRQITPSAASTCDRREIVNNTSDNNSVSNYLSDMVTRVLSAPSNTSSRERRRPIPEPVITNLNSLLSDIHVRYIRLRDFSLHYKVFDAIFYDLHRKMKDVDPYYKNYSSTVQFAGSHFDNLRIKKPDEFDMDIVISLPLNSKLDMFNPAQSDINIEAKAPGFVQLKMGVQFERLPMRDKEKWLSNRAAYEWKDDCSYLLGNKFIAWFKSVVTKALNQYELRDENGRPIVYVEGVPYIINVSESGPAMTLLIRNASKNFKMDVDLVPAIRFPEDRWPVSKAYRKIPSDCKKGYWMVVPKPNKQSGSVYDQNRSWRIALHNQERVLLYKTNNLRQAIRLIKKLRDAQNMDKIASYYIKTLFFWEIVEINDIFYWNNNPAVLFKRMVSKFHQALVVGNIPYFWNHRNNLIGGLPRDLLNQYARKLVPLMEILENPSQYKLVAKYLLDEKEFKEYNAKYLQMSVL